MSIIRPTLPQVIAATAPVLAEAGKLPWDGFGARRVAAPTYPLLTGGLIAWFEAGLTELDANGQLEQFDDVSGNGNHLACPAALASRPPIAASANYGDTPVIAFPGGAAGNQQLASRATWTQGAQAQPTCIVWIGDIADNVAGSARTLIDGGTNGSRQTIRRQNNSSGGFDMAALTSLPSGDVRTTPCIIWAIFAGVSSAIYIEDPETPKATGAPGTQAINGLTMAAAWGNTTGIPCNVWGAGVYKATDVGDFSESWRRAVGAYVWTKTSGAVGVEP